MSELPARLVLEIDLEAEQITGSMRANGEPARPFSGWLEFITAFEDWRRGRPQAEPPPPAGERPP